MPEQGNLELVIEVWEENKMWESRFPAHTLTKEYVKACTRAVMFDLHRQNVRPDRVRSYIE